MTPSRPLVRVAARASRSAATPLSGGEGVSPAAGGRSADPGAKLKLDLPIYATLSLCAGPILFYRSFRDMRTRRLIQNTPTARIRSMAMGLVEINGGVVSHSMQSAPFSGRPCAYWELDIATQNRRGWTVVHRNSSGHPFYVRDETGLALVYPKGADCKVRFGVSETCLGISLPPCYAQYMDDQQLALRHLWRLSNMRFRERLLEDGQKVFVLGSAEPRARALDVSDDQALESTGTDDVRGRRIRALHDETVAVVRRGQNEPTFIISQESERELTLDLGLRALGEAIAGPALSLFGLGYWLYALSSGRVFR